MILKRSRSYTLGRIIGVAKHRINLARAALAAPPVLCLLALVRFRER